MAPREGGTPATGIVLAGGRSRRFGGDKLSAPYKGAPLLHHAVRRLAEVCAEVCVVVAPGEVPPPLPPDVAVRLVHDLDEAQGPLAGLASALEAVSSELAVVAGGDMPELSEAVVREMVRLAGDLPADAVALRDGDRSRPLPMVVRVPPARAAGARLLEAGERSLRALLGALDTAVIDESVWTALDPGRGTLFDVDEPADLSGRVSP